MAKKEKILILVKTYPNKSSKYVETVCTAGIREDGSWVRLYPIPFRLYTDDQQYAKYQWIECSHYKKTNDPRPESCHIDIDQQIELCDKIGTQDKWEQRRRSVLDKVTIYTKFAELRKLVEDNRGSLAVFRPTSVKLRCEKISPNEIDEPEESVPSEIIQLDLFHENVWRSEFKRVEPIPYSFKYEITDAEGEKATHKIIDWELGTLFYREKQRLGSEELAKNSVKFKYGTEFLDSKKVDLHLYMGTMLQFQRRRMPNPWTIIGVAPFPKVLSRPVDLFAM